MELFTNAVIFDTDSEGKICDTKFYKLEVIENHLNMTTYKATLIGDDIMPQELRINYKGNPRMIMSLPSNPMQRKIIRLLDGATAVDKAAALRFAKLSELVDVIHDTMALTVKDKALDDMLSYAMQIYKEVGENYE